MAVITMLTDFGSRDAYVGVMKGVILGIDPGARLVGTYTEAPPGGPVVLVGSSGYLEIAVNRGNAAGLTGVKRGDMVRLQCPDPMGSP